MKEADIEKFVRMNTEGYLLKWVSPGQSGVPDRLWFSSFGIVPIEFKKPGGRLSERQKLWIERFEDLGIVVPVIGSMEEAKQFCNLHRMITKRE